MWAGKAFKSCYGNAVPVCQHNTHICFLTNLPKGNTGSLRNCMRKHSENKNKKPHLLPPLSQNLMEPLKPPSVIQLEGRLGSPIPKWHRPYEHEEPEVSAKDKPRIQITPCVEETRRRHSMKNVNTDFSKHPTRVDTPAVKSDFPKRYTTLKPITRKSSVE